MKVMWDIHQLKATALGVGSLALIIFGKINMENLKPVLGLITSFSGIVVAVFAVINYRTQIRKNNMEIEKMEREEKRNRNL